MINVWYRWRLRVWRKKLALIETKILIYKEIKCFGYTEEVSLGHDLKGARFRVLMLEHLLGEIPRARALKPVDMYAGGE